jgi:ABC-type bacteriocin/lantibiotic exporter with double-glycine peptidase domain
MLVFFLSFGGTFYLIKNYLYRIGEERLISNHQRFKELSNTFDSIKELKLNGLEKIFIDRFSKSAKIYSTNSSFALALAQVPRYFIEAIAFGGMIVLMLFLTYQKRNFIDILPFITLYAFVGYRLIPAAQQIYNSLTTIRFIGPAINNLDKNLNYLKKSEKKNISLARSISLNQVINIKNVNYCYPNSKKLALKNINIQIPAHSKIGIIGLTGSGKTTLIDLMLGLLDLNEGVIEVDGEKIDKQNLRSWQKNIGYVPQQIFLSDTSIAENIAFGQDFENIDLETVKKVSKIVDLDEFISSELSEGYKTIIGERGVRLSGGQRQRIGIARALYKKPNILILDEATNALDNLTEKKVMQNIVDFRNKITIIIITHRLNSVRDCNNIILLKKGEIKDQGTYDDIERRNEKFFNIPSFKIKDKK